MNAIIIPISHFTVECLVTWPMKASEAGGDLNTPLCLTAHLNAN